MEHYSVLLVDDEEEVLNIMQKKLPWEELGFHIAGKAFNGMEAMAAAEELKPDVVLTDVQMPYMDGLTLCKNLKKSHEGIKVVIFSGFDTFEYAKEAVGAAAEEYILKPVSAEELREVFLRIKNTLDRERSDRRSVEQLRDYYEKSLPILQDGFFTALLEGRVRKEELSRAKSSYQLELDYPYYVVSLLHMKGEVLRKSTENPMLMEISLKRFAEEELLESGVLHVQVYSGNVVLIAGLHGPEEQRSFTDRMERFCSRASRLLACPVIAAIGTLCERPDDLKLSFEAARQALSYRRLYRENITISMAEIEHETPQKGEKALQEFSSAPILKAIRLGGEKELSEVISDYVERLFDTGLSLSAYRLLVLELITSLCRFALENGLKSEEVFSLLPRTDNEDPYRVFEHLEEKEGLSRWLTDACAYLSENIREIRRKSSNSFVSQAREYLEESYPDPELNIDAVCRLLNVSAAYFSTIFKKETGKTFVSYLTDIRMEKAADMLLTGDEKSYEVAEKVGFTDPNYFSYVFKKRFGVSPSKYRTRMGEDESNGGVGK